jgi:pimeloyl-ACP methyl ester carboxylesterase
MSSHPPTAVDARTEKRILSSVLLAHDDVGAGPAVVLLHAGVADRRMWAEHLAPISNAGYRTIAVDLPAFGESLPEEPVAPWDDVVATLDMLCIDRAVLVGNSFGGAIALRAALAAPERVTGLMLVSAPPPQLHPSPELSSVWEAEESALEAGDVERAVLSVLDAWTLPDTPAPLRARIASMQRRAFEVQAAAGSLTEAEDPLEADPQALAKIATPALVISGELDFADFRDGAGTLASELPHAHHVVIPDAGHLVPLDQPERFRQLLFSFLDELDTQR